MIVDENSIVDDDSVEFWGLFRGFSPINKMSGNDTNTHIETTLGKMFSVSYGQPNNVEGPLPRWVLEPKRCYLLDCGAEIYVWVGHIT